MTRTWEAMKGSVASLSPGRQDALVYGSGAAFAVVVALASGFRFYRQWAFIALGPYLAGMALSWLADRRAASSGAQTGSEMRIPASGGRARARCEGAGSSARRITEPVRALVGRLSGDRRALTRMVIFGLVLIGATLVPMTLEIHWGDSQSEVKVVEQAGHRVVDGSPPYVVVNPAHPQRVGAGEPESNVFDPYLPLMAILGIAHNLPGPGLLTDPRVGFLFVSLVATVAALALCRGGWRPKMMVLQCMTVLPTAALALSTGGDDVPVAALGLLGVVLLARRRPAMAGVVLGTAASMKMTAWPLAAVAVMAATDLSGTGTWRARCRYLVGMVAVVLVGVVPAALADVPAFVQNVIRFPLGLAGIQSPAASPLLGHLIVADLPRWHDAVLGGVGLVGLGLASVVLSRRPLRSAASVCRFVAVAMALVVVLAPSTRIGYLGYPLDLLVWSWMLGAQEQVGTFTSPEGGDFGADQPPSLMINKRMVKVVTPVAEPGGKAVGAISTPSCQ